MLYFLIASVVIVQTIHGHPDTQIKVVPLVERINSKATTWTADTYGFETLDTNNVKRNMLGMKSRGHHRALPKPETFSNFEEIAPAASDLPENFNWVNDTKNFGCRIGDIRDQSNCGSCWAVSTASAFGDRLCLATKGKFKTPLSAHHLTGCNKKNYGCNGGYMDQAHAFLVDNGLVTGGEYDSEEGCQPYSFMPCGYGDPKKFLCFEFGVNTPKCLGTKCSNEVYPHKKEPRLIKASTWYPVGSPKDEYSIRKNIYEKGPITAGFWVMVDLMFYKKGIYIPSRERENYVLGGHAVRVVGWGVENEVKYWLVANSWGTEWGENGFFRIIRGVNAVGFESDMTAAEPIVP